MAKARAIDRRRKSVGNIKKITRTMQLIATARFQKSLKQAVGTRPYTEKITELVRQVSSAGGQVEHPLFKKNEETANTVGNVLEEIRGHHASPHDGKIAREHCEDCRAIDDYDRERAGEPPFEEPEDEDGGDL